jgi:protoporphyrinogen IX oxidase
MEISVEAYLWLKALHIIAVVCWMVGLLYLPRLFVYHCKVAPGSEADQLFQTMERKLMRGIMLPSMLATWGLGLWLAIKTGAFAPDNGGWLHAKLFLVLLLSGYHGICSRYRKAFSRGEKPKSETYFRFFNEIPAVMLVVIVILVVLKPF